MNTITYPNNVTKCFNSYSEFIEAKSKFSKNATWINKYDSQGDLHIIVFDVLKDAIRIFGEIVRASDSYKKEHYLYDDPSEKLYSVNFLELASSEVTNSDLDLRFNLCGYAI